MARKRMIDPGFWDDEKIIELEFAERLLFIGYWNFADDNGVHPYSLKSLKARVFPSDDIPMSTFEQIINGLIDEKLLIPFYNNEFLFCPMWAKHQTINKPQANSNPIPPIGTYDQQKKLFSEGKLRDVINEFLGLEKPLPEHYGNNTGTFLPNRIEENIREEKGSEEEENAREQPSPPSLAQISVSKAIEQEFGRTISPMEIEQITAWEHNHANDVILEAVKRAVLLGKYNFKYIDSILLEWEKQNIRTVLDIQQHEEKFKQNKGGPKNRGPNPGKFALLYGRNGGT